MLFLISRLTQKPLIIRKFGGDDYRKRFGIIGRTMIEFILRRVELYLVQTQELIYQTQERGIPNVSWYPTSRPSPEIDQPIIQAKHRCQRFVYVGRIFEAKGMRVLADAGKRLPSAITVDVYGHWIDDFERTVFDDCPQVTYRGMLKPQEVIPTMQKYDASLLPTHYSGEGYPGAVLESYFAGLPVIATRWQALPEIIDDNVGILVEPKNADELLHAMLRLSEDTELFQRLRSNTSAKAAFFSTEHWGGRFIDYCRELRERCRNP
jgi:glycosyltransferase involved in cell wall biosynthesis